MVAPDFREGCMSAAKLGFTRLRLLCAGFAAAERIADNFIDFGGECAANRPGHCSCGRVCQGPIRVVPTIQRWWAPISVHTPRLRGQPLAIAFSAPAGRGGSLRGGLHDVLHDVLADLPAHGGADDSREAIMEAGPDARVRYFLAKDIQIGESMDDPGCCRACH